MSNPYDDWAFETKSLRTGQTRTHECEHSEPIFTTSSFVFESAEHAEARFSGEQPGNIYSRFTNPTVRTFQERLAILEGGESCVATASGMAAILSTCLALLESGDHIVTSSELFGSTVSLFNNYIKKLGIDVSFVPLTDLDAWSSAIQDNTKILFLETPSNPATQIADISALADIAHKANAKLVVDNCILTPALQRPLSLGADIVIHSATKYIDGQGRCIGGAVVGDKDDVGDKVFRFIRTCGPSMSPFNAWVFSKGLETLSLRMNHQSASALKIATFLEQHPAVEKVNYPGLESHPQHALACKQQSAHGAIVSFVMKGGKTAAFDTINATQVISITANLGDVKSIITHPATTTHARVEPKQREAAGVTPGLVRLAVGLESPDDLIADLSIGLDKHK